jgi:integrase
LGLQWSDVDFAAGTLKVRRQLQRLDGTYVLTQLKTERSQRTLALGTLALDALRAQRERQTARRLLLGAAWEDSGQVFTTTRGGYLAGSTVTHHFAERLKKAGVPAMPFHNLRQGAASLLLAEGADLRTVMEQLGHSTIALTGNTYSHIAPTLLRDAAEKLDRALRPRQ